MGWFERDKILPAEPSTALITTLFNDGKAAIVFSGPWFLGEIADDIDYGLAPLPTITETGNPMRPWMTVEGVYITAPSKHKDEAYEFVTYITDVPAAKIMALEGRQTPANETSTTTRRHGRHPARGFPRAGRGGHPDAQPARDVDGLVAGDHRDEQDRQRYVDASERDGRGAEKRNRENRRLAAVNWIRSRTVHRES